MKFFEELIKNNINPSAASKIYSKLAKPYLDPILAIILMLDPLTPRSSLTYSISLAETHLETVTKSISLYYF